MHPPRPSPITAGTSKHREARTLQLLDLVPCELGDRLAGIYVVDNQERCVLAGPFTQTADAVAWIDANAPRSVPSVPDRTANTRR